MESDGPGERGRKLGLGWKQTEVNKSETYLQRKIDRTSWTLHIGFYLELEDKGSSNIRKSSEEGEAGGVVCLGAEWVGLSRVCFSEEEHLSRFMVGDSIRDASPTPSLPVDHCFYGQDAKWTRSQETLDQFWTLPLSSCKALGKSIHLSRFQFPFLPYQKLLKCLLEYTFMNICLHWIMTRHRLKRS